MWARLVVIFLSVFVYLVPQSTSAFYNFTTQCSTDQPYAQFVLANSAETNGHPDYDPRGGREFCIPVLPIQTSVTAEQMSTAGVIPANLPPAFQMTRKQYRACSTSGETALGLTDGWEDFQIFSTRAAIFDLRRTNKNPCRNDQAVYPRKRYAISGVGLLYFIGMAGEGNAGQQSVPVCKDFNQAECNATHCFWSPRLAQCLNRTDTKVCPSLTSEPNLCGRDGSREGSTICVWNKDTNKCNTPLQATLSAGTDFSQPGAFPNCGLDGTCDSINDVLEQQLGYANWAFSLIGVVAFVSFVVGGFLMITSFGDAEKFKKGAHLLVAAVIGLVISFSAYLVVNFILDSLQVTDEFRAVK